MQVSQYNTSSDGPACAVGPGGRRSRRAFRGFTLIEMLVVLGIIGIIASISIGPVSNLLKNAGMSVAQRQLRNVFSYARNVALRQRSTVYVVFVPPNITQADPADYTGNDFTLFNRGVGGQGTAYALYVKRRVGDQPGNTDNPQYLTDWEYLPQNVFIHSNELTNADIFTQERLRYPIVNSTNAMTPFNGAPPDPTDPNFNEIPLRYVAFSAEGGLKFPSGVEPEDLWIPLTEGSVLRAKNPDGTFKHELPNVVEKKLQIKSGDIAPGFRYYVRSGGGSVNYNMITYAGGESFEGIPGVTTFTPASPGLRPRVDIFEGLHINWLTGRAKIVRPVIK